MGGSGCWACGLKIKLKLCSRNARLLWGRSALLLYSRWGEGVGVLVAVVLLVVLLLWVLGLVVFIVVMVVLMLLVGVGVVLGGGWFWVVGGVGW